MMSSSVTRTSFFLFAPFGEDGIRAVFGLFLAVAQGCSLFEILGLDGGLVDAICSICASMSFTFGGRVMAAIRAREPPSSITSMALSGQKASGQVTVGELCCGFEGFVGNPGL